MRKSLKIIMIIVLALPFFGSTVLADESEQSTVIPDKVFEIDYDIKDEANEHISVADNFFEKPGYLLEFAGDTYAQVTVTSASMIKSFSNHYGEAVVVEENETDGTKILQFKVDDVTQAIEFDIHVTVPGLYDTTHKTQLVFETGSQTDSDVAGHVLVVSEKGNGPAVDEGIEEPETIALNDGYYMIDVAYLKEESDDRSAMASYMDTSAFLEVKDGVVQATLTVDDETVTLLKVNDDQSISQVVDGEKRHETFSLDTLTAIVSGYAEYQAPYNGGVFEGNADFRMAFDADSLIEAEVSDKPGNDVEEEDKEDQDTPEIIALKDGYYTMDVAYLKEDTDDLSSMGNYLEKSVFLKVENGQTYATITVNDDKTVTKLLVADEKAVTKVVDGDKRHETFEVAQLSTVLNGYVAYQAPYGDGIFEGEASFDIALNEDSIQPVKASDQPGIDIDDEDDKQDQDKEEDKDEDDQDKEDNDGSTDTGDKSALTPDQAYEIGYVIKDADGQKESTANGFFVKPATLLYKDGDIYAQLTITNSDMVKELTTKHGDVVIVKKNKDGSVVVQFLVSGDLSEAIQLDMRVVVPGLYDTKHTTQLVFDLASRKEIKIGNNKLVQSANKNGPTGDSNQPGQPNKPDDKEDIDKEDTDNKTDDKPNKQPDENKNDGQQPGIEDDQSILTPDQAFEIDYVIKDADGKNISTANDFFVKPATLLYKDGKIYAQLTITNSDMIKSLKTKHGDVVIVKENDDGSVIVQFLVAGDLSEAIQLDMRVVVPGLYDSEHTAQLIFAVNSQKEIASGEYMLVTSSNANGPLGDKTPEKPEFGQNNTDETNKQPIEKTDNENPQTGDTTNILLYVLLLVGSLAPLAMKLKKRFI